MTDGMRYLNNAARQIGVYVHIPFCVRKCSYCDFLSAPADDDTKLRYTRAVIREIEQTKQPGNEYKLRSIFVGGGTPSILEAGQIADIMHALKHRFGHIIADEGMEATIECNPGTVTADKLKVYRQSGFNRISFGLQTADDNELVNIGRIHTWKDFVRSFELARAAGFNNINVDLMLSLPDQTEESWRRTLDSVVKLSPEHISAYSLILEEGTPLYSQIAAERACGIDRLADEDSERRMYYAAVDMLTENGYEQYEISNFAKPGYESVHNLSYWECKEYLGFGIGAASLYRETRYHNAQSLEEYISKGAVKEDVEELTLNSRMSEFMFLGLRKVRDGISVTEFEQLFKCSYDKVFGEVTRKYIRSGLLKQRGDRIILTRRGIDVSNVVMSEFIID